MDDLKTFMSMVYDTMADVPAGCYRVVENIWNVIGKKVKQGGVANREETATVRGAQVDAVNLESAKGNWAGRLEVWVSEDKKRLVFSRVKKLENTRRMEVKSISMDFDVVDGEVLLSRVDNVSGQAYPYSSDDEGTVKYQFDLTFLKTTRNPESKENYLEKTKTEVKYIRYSESEAALLNRVAQSLCRIFIWGAPNENITNIRPLRMVDGHLEEAVLEENLSTQSLVYSGPSMGSTAVRDVRLRILKGRGNQK